MSLSSKNKSELHDVDIIAHSEPILNQIPHVCNLRKKHELISGAENSKVSIFG